MTEDLFIFWIKNELKFFLDKQRAAIKKPNAKGLFIIDRFAGHFSNEFEDIKKDLNIDLLYIPASTTCAIQPLDLMINKILKNLVKEMWMNWYLKINIEASPLEHPCRQDIYNWVMKAWDLLSPREIIYAFLTSGISNSLDGTEDSLSKNINIMKEFVDKTKLKEESKMQIENEDKPNEMMEIEYKESVEDGFDFDYYSNQEMAEESSTIGDNLDHFVEEDKQEYIDELIIRSDSEEEGDFEEEPKKKIKLE